MHVLPIRIHNVWLAIDAGHVEQILGERAWFWVPSAPLQWPGVLAWHGRAVAVLDLALLLGMAGLQPGVARQRTVIAKARGCLLAIPVDEIREAQLIVDELLRPLHATRPPYATYELELEAMVMPLLDPVALVSEALLRSRAPGSPASPATTAQ